MRECTYSRNWMFYILMVSIFLWYGKHALMLLWCCKYCILMVQIQWWILVKQDLRVQIYQYRAVRKHTLLNTCKKKPVYTKYVCISRELSINMSTCSTHIITDVCIRQYNEAKKVIRLNTETFTMLKIHIKSAQESTG